MSDQPGKKSASVAIVLAISSTLATIADFAGIAQLSETPIMAIVIVLVLAAIVLVIYAMLAREANGSSSWLVGGAVVCVIIATVLAVVAMVEGRMLEGSATAGPTTAAPPATKDSSVSLPSSNQQETPVFLETQLHLWLSKGLDIDVQQPQVITATAATGATDIVLTQYGTLQGSKPGFYEKNPDSSEDACRDYVRSGRNTEKEVFAIAGKEYCLKTSGGSTAWLQIVESTTTAFSPNERGAKLAVKVWR